jgi:hypothetical protein
MGLQPSKLYLQAVESCTVAKNWATCPVLERASTRVAREQDAGCYERSVPQC